VNGRPLRWEVDIYPSVGIHEIDSQVPRHTMDLARNARGPDSQESRRQRSSAASAVSPSRPELRRPAANAEARTERGCTAPTAGGPWAADTAT
jgi:hypothetical protein